MVVWCCAPSSSVSSSTSRVSSPTSPSFTPCLPLSSCSSPSLFRCCGRASPLELLLMVLALVTDVAEYAKYRHTKYVFPGGRLISVHWKVDVLVHILLSRVLARSCGGLRCKSDGVRCHVHCGSKLRDDIRGPSTCLVHSWSGRDHGVECGPLPLTVTIQWLCRPRSTGRLDFLIDDVTSLCLLAGVVRVPCAMQASTVDTFHASLLGRIPRRISHIFCTTVDSDPHLRQSLLSGCFAGCLDFPRDDFSS